MFKNIVMGITILVAIIGLMFGLSYIDIIHKSIFQPMSRQIDYNTFKNSQQYVDSMVRDLQQYRTQYYLKSDTENKTIIKSTVQREFANFPSEKVPDYLKSFYNEMMQ